MNIIDYIRATKAQKSIGTEFAEDIAKWECRHATMVVDMINGPKKPISLKIDEMNPENLIFYNISGSKLIDNNTLFSVDTTTIDNFVDYTQHIYPTYILVKDHKKSKEPTTVDTTQMFRINYHKNKDASLIQYTIDTLINNEDSTTSRFFPKLFCSLSVCTSSRFYDSRKVMTYKPLKDYRAGNRFIHKENFEPIVEIYENRIISQLRKFANHPHSTYNPEQEM